MVCVACVDQCCIEIGLWIDPAISRHPPTTAVTDAPRRQEVVPGLRSHSGTCL